MSSIPILQALKVYGTHFNIKDFISLPVDTPFGNLYLTYSEIVIRIECLNGSIISIYEYFHTHNELVKARGGGSTLDEGYKHNFEIEQIIYWLRKTADELISMLYIFSYFKNNSEFPTQIKISSIGKLLKSDQVLDDKLTTHLNLLDRINKVSNGFKHFIVNTQVHNHRGLNEPVVFALTAFNDTASQPKFHAISLKTLLESYNSFLTDVKDILKSKYQNV